MLLQSWKSDNPKGSNREKSNIAIAILEKEQFDRALKKSSNLISHFTLNSLLFRSCVLYSLHSLTGSAVALILKQLRIDRSDRSVFVSVKVKRTPDGERKSPSSPFSHHPSLSLSYCDSLLPADRRNTPDLLDKEKGNRRGDEI